MYRFVRLIFILLLLVTILINSTGCSSVAESHNGYKVVDEAGRDPALRNVQAVKNKQLYYPREGYIYNCSQDAVFGAVEIARAAYGKEFIQDGTRHISVL